MHLEKREPGQFRGLYCRAIADIPHVLGRMMRQKLERAYSAIAYSWKEKQEYVGNTLYDHSQNAYGDY